MDNPSLSGKPKYKQRESEMRRSGPCVCMRACVCVCVYIYIYIYICVCMADSPDSLLGLHFNLSRALVHVIILCPCISGVPVWPKSRLCGSSMWVCWPGPPFTAARQSAQPHCDNAATWENHMDQAKCDHAF